MNIKFDKLLSEIDHVLPEKKHNSFFLHSTNATKQRIEITYTYWKKIFDWSEVSSLSFRLSTSNALPKK